MHEYRSTSASDQASPSDTTVTSGMKERGLGKGSVLGFYGVGHLLGQKDLDELLTDMNGRVTKTIMPDMPNHHSIVQTAIDAKKGIINLPDYLSSPATGQLREINQLQHPRDVYQWWNSSMPVDISTLGELPPSHATSKEFQPEKKTGYSIQR